jgi:prepilin-type N-terminal cleavage/methylation domain-containing protein
MNSRVRVPPKGEAGFTLMEMLAALALSALLGTVMWGALSGGTLSARRILSEATENATLLRLDDRLRNVAVRVQTPFWLPGAQTTETEGGFTVNWLDGEFGRWATFEVTDEGVTINDGERTTRYAGFEEAHLSLVREGDASVGVRLSIQGGAPVEMVARFGGSGLRTAAETAQ